MKSSTMRFLSAAAMLALSASASIAQQPVLGQYDPLGQSRAATTPNDGTYYGGMNPPFRPAGPDKESQVFTLSPNTNPIPLGNGNPTTGFNTLGSYSMGAVSGTIGAGLSAGSPVYSYRYTGQNYSVVRRVDISAGDSATAFTAGFGNCQMFAARAFTASDTGGTSSTITGNNGKLRTSLPPTQLGNLQIANTGTMTAGTRTLDTTPLASLSFGIQATAGVQLFANTIFDARATQQPLVLANNEGFVIQCTVPATGTWALSVQVFFDEMSVF